MKKASISQAKNQLSALIDRIKAGGSVLIVDRGRPVARLEPVGRSADADATGRLSQLVRDGLVRPAARPLPRRVLDTAPPKPTEPGAALRAFLEERRKGR